MGKRLIRIRASLVAEQTTGLIGREVNLVLLSGRTLHGRLLTVQDGELALRDSIGHQHTVSLQAMDELIFDEEAPF